MRNGYRRAILVVLVLTGVIATVGLYFWNLYNPVYHGQRVYAWAEQAIWDDDSAARQRAAQVVVEAVKSMQGDPRTQLVMRFCSPERGGQAKQHLPKEVLPILLEALRAKDMLPNSYPAMALSRLEPGIAVPALLDMLQRENDAEVRVRITAALKLLK